MSSISFVGGPEEEQLLYFPISTLMEIGSSDEEDDAEVDYVKSLEPSSSFPGDDSLSPIVGIINKGPSNVAMTLDENLVSVPTNVGASTQHNRVSSPSPKNYIQEPTRNPSSEPSIQPSALDGFNIPKSKRKKSLKKISNSAIQELDEPLSEEYDGSLISRNRPRRLLMDFAKQILEFPAYVENDVRVDKDKAIDGTEGCPDTSFTSHGHLNTLLITPSEVGCPDGTVVVNVDKGKATNATEGTSESNQCSWGGATANDIVTKHALLVEQAQKMASVAHDIVVQMQAGYEESQNKMKAMEAEHSVLDNRLSQAEVAWANAESQLEQSEALRVDASEKMLSLEVSNSELANRLELLESEKKRLVERVEMLEAVDAERAGQLEVAKKGLTGCRADLEWVLREGLPRCFDNLLESEALLTASTRLGKACTDYGIEHGCRLMRDRFQLAVADAELPNYKPDRMGEVNEAYSSFAKTDFVAAAGLAELSVEALRDFCLSSDDESN
ncbi:hypothetical protein L1887_18517 [Cichorium endivia]|nr:hypothetical protein L1887_18517 [Cichorium endivia]